jgi:hypothetical protein
MTFRVQLTNPEGLRLTVHVPAESDRDAVALAATQVNADSSHARYGPWEAGYSIRAS